MKSIPLSIQFLNILVFLLFSAGCTRPPASAPTPPLQETQTTASAQGQSIPPSESIVDLRQNHQSTSCTDQRTVRHSERNRAHCYHLRPAVTVLTPKKHSIPTLKGAKTTKLKKGSHSKKKEKKTGRRATSPKERYRKTTRCCQPQSLIYARCRTGISTCRLGDTSPVQWFACARKNGATTSTPRAGSVMVLDANSRRGMPTGHPAYVEAVHVNPDGTWTLRISHTNYDRKCHLDLDATVLFHPKHMTATFQSGHWGHWARGLKVLGFILR